MNGDGQNANGAQASQEASLYPYTSLAPSMKISDAVAELGGARSEVSKSRLAAFFKESEKSASFLQRVSSAKAFGLIIGRSDYLLSDAAKRYYHPTSESDKSNALLSFLSTPSSFRETIRLFDGGQLPKREILGNIFGEKFKVPDSWKERAAAFFENSAQFVGVIDDNRYLRFKATQHATAAQALAPQPAKTQKEGPKFAGGSTILSMFGSPDLFDAQEQHSLFLDKDKTKKVTLSCPLMITRAEYNRIIKWIDATWIIEEEEKENEPN